LRTAIHLLLTYLLTYWFRFFGSVHLFDAARMAREAGSRQRLGVRPSVCPSPPVRPISRQQQRQPAGWLLSTSMRARCGVRAAGAPALSSKCRQLGNGRASVRPSPPVCPINRQQQRQPADWLPRTSMRARCGLQARRRSAANAGSVRRELTAEAQHGLVYPRDAVASCPPVRPSVRPSVCHKSKFYSKRLDSSTDAFLNALHFKEIQAPA